MTNRRTSLEELDMLHAQVAHSLKSALGTMRLTDSEGNPTPGAAAMLNVASNFLKANGITGSAPQSKRAMDFLNEASLPFLENAIRSVTDKSMH